MPTMQAPVWVQRKYGIGVVNCRSALNEELHGLHVPSEARLEERRRSLLVVDRIDLGACIEQSTHRIDLSA